MPDLSPEISHGRDAGKIICGVDEVGRGPLAGPVVAAAVIIPEDCPAIILARVQDSKKLSRDAREEISEILMAHCRFAVAEASVAEIDELNILWASMLAMQRAVDRLGATILRQPIGARSIDIALIDGNRIPKLACQAVPIIKGDDKSLSIAAASIIAKTYRDRLMRNLANEFPDYGWERNAGYGTAYHLEALTRHGITVWHRSSFAPVAARRQSA